MFEVAVRRSTMLKCLQSKSTGLLLDNESLLQPVSVIQCAFVLMLLSDGYVCSSGRLQSCGPR